MPLRTRPDTETEKRYRASGPITLVLEYQSKNVISGELKDLSACGFRVCLKQATLEPGQLAEIHYAYEKKKVRIVWVRQLQNGIESGLLLHEAYLIQRAKAGDGQAFIELTSPYVRSLYRTVRSILHNQEDAEEVLQETWLKVLLHLNQFRPGQSLKPWLAQIATHEAFKHLRKNRRHGHDSIYVQQEVDNEQEPFASFVDPGESPADALERREFAEAISTALGSLTETYRQMFILRELRDFSVIEAARVLGINVDTANTRLHRARLQIRKQLQPSYAPALLSAKTPRSRRNTT